jgi:hypothetical protein
MKHFSEIKPEVKVKPLAVAAKSSLLTGMATATALGYTNNGAVTYTNSGSNCLDFFAQAGAMRKSPEQALNLFKKAFAEDRLTAVRTLFYLRDVRGGQGERKLFRLCLQWIGENFNEVLQALVQHVPYFGRWDDLFFNEPACLSVIKAQLMSDLRSDKPSLLAKWLPTANASSATTRAKAAALAKALDLSTTFYRKLVRHVRKRIATVEEKMSAQKWSDINYSTVPSQASRIYRKAFKLHDDERYSAFVEAATKGEAKINASTLYPYQIYASVNSSYTNTLEALWRALPDYTQGKNALVVADVSGSMSGQPMSVSVSLALYFAERNKGIFKDHFITFSGTPLLQQIKGKTLLERMSSIEQAHWEQNTNLQKVFEMLLEVAIANNVPESEMPSTLYIISDMEFDSCTTGVSNFEDIKFKYLRSGYMLPNLVFWNVDASGKNVPVRSNEYGVSLVSGFSPVIFKIAVENKTAQQIMLDTVNAERYAVIKLA